MRTKILAAVLLGFLPPNLAYSLLPSLSFGQTSPLADKSGTIPHFTVLGEGYNPRLMSDRAILTPPNPGNKRGALWTKERQTATDWSVDLDFRSSGPEKAGGNLQLWYVANGVDTVGTSSIYTVGKFDGLVVVVDTHGGSAGTIRGFLNDGARDYHNDPMIDGLAFGHCNYAYRNLGRPSKLTINSSPSNGLEVHIDDNLCFHSGKIMLPKDYYLGVTAASSDTADSIEVFKLSSYSNQQQKSAKDSSNPPAQQIPAQSRPATDKSNKINDEPQDTDSASYLTTAAQFSELHSRLQLLSHAVHNLFLELSTQNSANERRHNELIAQVKSSTSSSSSTSNSAADRHLTSLDQRLTSIESTLALVKSDLESSDHRGQFARIHDRLERAQIGISDHLPEALASVVRNSAPRVGALVALVMAVQIGLAAAYVVYKRRRSMAPKKYL